MPKAANSRQGRQVVLKSIKRTELELQISSLMETLSLVRGATESLTQTLQSVVGNACAQNAREAEVMLKHALRLLGDAMSQLPW